MKKICRYNYRFYPTEQQEKYIMGMFSAKRVFWNNLLDMYNEFCEHNRNNPDDKINVRICKGNKSPIFDGKMYSCKNVAEYANSHSDSGKDYSWLTEYHCLLYESVGISLYRAFERYYKYISAVKAGNSGLIEVGVPRHKKMREVNSAEIRNPSSYTDGKKLIDWKHNLIKTPGYRKIGWCRCVLHRRFKGDIKYTTFIKDTDGKWYISLCISEEVNDVEFPTEIDPSSVVGIDAGLKTRMVLANADESNDEYTEIRDNIDDDIKHLEKKIKRLQRALSRCTVTYVREGAASRVMTVKESDKLRTENKNAFNGYSARYSNGYRKLQSQISSIKAIIRRKRENYNNVVSSRIVSDPNVKLISIEDLSISDMMARNKTKKKRGLTVDESGSSVTKPRRKMASHFGDLAIGEFNRMLEYKAEMQGKRFVKVGRYFPSSQLCPHCGYRNKEVKNLSVRSWTCPQCGAVNNRDGGAAKNIAKEGLRIFNEKQSE